MATKHPPTLFHLTLFYEPAFWLWVNDTRIDSTGLGMDTQALRRYTTFSPSCFHKNGSFSFIPCDHFGITPPIAEQRLTFLTLIRLYAFLHLRLQTLVSQSPGSLWDNVHVVPLVLSCFSFILSCIRVPPSVGDFHDGKI
jgi:hypothetical protein